MEYDIMTEGDMSSDQIWGDEPLTWHFRSLTVFMDFYTSVHREIIDIIDNNIYDSSSSMLDFYHQFKNQNQPLETFYKENYRATMTEDSLNCIGMAILTRRRFIQNLAKKFPFLASHLFMASSNGYDFKEIPENFRDVPPNETGQFKQHALLALKITLESGRRGFIFFEATYAISIPVVIMEDGLFPHTGQFWVRGSVDSRYNHFRYYSPQYVQWQVTRKSELEIDQEPKIHRWFYMGRKLINVKELDKRNRIEYFHGYIQGDVEGVKAGFYKINDRHEGQLVFFTLENETDRSLTATNVSLEYFVSPELNKDPKIENLLEKVAHQTKKELAHIRTLLKKFCAMFLDKQFLNAVDTLDKTFDNIVNSYYEN